MNKKGCILAAVISAVVIFILTACALVCFLFVSLVSELETESISNVQAEIIREGGEDKIVVIRVEGIIMEEDMSGGLLDSSSYASANQIVNYIDNAMSDDSVKAIVMSHDTPGGDVYASDLIYQKIKEAQQEGLVVVTVMRGVSASGGYYIAAPSDKIFASPLTITGSIGVIMQFQSMAELYEKIGIESRIITNRDGDYKTGEGLFDDDPDGEEDQIYQRIVDDAFDKFVEVIVEGRELDEEDVRKIADGRIFSGQQAQEVGLIDEFGGIAEAISEAENLAGISNSTVVEYSDLDWLSEMFAYIGNSDNILTELSNRVDTRPGPRLAYIYIEE